MRPIGIGIGVRGGRVGTASRVARDLAARFHQVRRSGPGARVRIPVVALMLAATVVGVALVTRPLRGSLAATTAWRWGVSPDFVADRQWWRWVTSLVLTRDAFMTCSIAASLVVSIGAYEYLAGHARALAVAIGGAVAGSALVGAGALLLGRLGWRLAAAAAASIDYGFSAGVAAGAGAVAAVLRHRTMTAVCSLVIAGGLLVHHQMADWDHAASFLATFGFLRLSRTTTAPG